MTNHLRQRGMALISSLLLLIIITVLALSMFRNFGTQERIAGNMRDKERARHVANATLQYAEWWLTQNTNTAAGAITCSGAPLNGNALNAPGQICDAPLTDLMHPGTWSTGVQYIPGYPSPLVDAYSSPIAGTPQFYIYDLGQAADALGEAYQIDAFSYGASTNTVAVVESTYEVQQGVVNRGAL